MVKITKNRVQSVKIFPKSTPIRSWSLPSFFTNNIEIVHERFEIVHKRLSIRIWRPIPSPNTLSSLICYNQRKSPSIFGGRAREKGYYHSSSQMLLFWRVKASLLTSVLPPAPPYWIPSSHCMPATGLLHIIFWCCSLTTKISGRIYILFILPLSFFR